VVDFGHNRDLFPDADVFPCVLITRRPTSAEDPPEKAVVAVIPGDRVEQDQLAATVAIIQFPMLLRSFEKSGWVLEPPDVRSLLERVQRSNPTLSEYAGVRPYRGLLTGLNEAFVVDTATRDRLVAEDPASAETFRPFVRGQDIERWAADWPGLWMITLKSSSDHAWPWSNEKSVITAEKVFAATYPSLHRRMTSYATKLRIREDQGRFWWELRSCAYYSVFDRPKILYQEIQFNRFLAVWRGWINPIAASSQGWSAHLDRG
jgi:hypothetical protein